MSTINKQYGNRDAVLEIATDTVCENFAGTSKSSGKDYSMNKQTGWLHIAADNHPTKCSVLIEDISKPYAIGFYEIKNAVSVGAFDSLAISRDIEFVPLKAATS